MLLPVRPVTRPAILTGQTNGRLDPEILVSIPGLAGGPTVRLVEPAATGWRALTAAASAAGHTLKATSAVDSYRPYDVQEATFLRRYTTVPIANTSTRTWQGKTWYLIPGNAPAAAPGTSNHGWGLAVDTGEERDSDAQAEPLDLITLTWLVEHELDYGFSHEIQEENWHIRWFVGDQIPPAVRDFMEGENMPLTLQDIDKIADAVWAKKLSGPGLTYSAGGLQLDTFNTVTLGTHNVDALKDAFEALPAAVVEALPEGGSFTEQQKADIAAAVVVALTAHPLAPKS